MAIREIITANCENGQLSKSKIARQWDDQGTLIQFAGYPEPETDDELIFRLIVWMRASEDAEPVELPPIELEADQWLISNYYTQLPQMLRFQLCITNGDETYEKHSPIFSGIVDKSLSHNGEEADIDVIPLFDPYKKYIDELILDAGARVVDTELDETSTNLVQNKAVAKAVANVNGRLRDAKEDLKNAFDLFNIGEVEPNFVWENGSWNSAGKEASEICIRPNDYIYASDVERMVMSTEDGYQFALFMWNENDTYIGYYGSAWQTSMDYETIAGYKYAITVRKSSNTAISPSESTNFHCTFYKTGLSQLGIAVQENATKIEEIGNVIDSKYPYPFDYNASLIGSDNTTKFYTPTGGGIKNLVIHNHGIGHDYYVQTFYKTANYRVIVIRGKVGNTTSIYLEYAVSGAFSGIETFSMQSASYNISCDCTVDWDVVNAGYGQNLTLQKAALSNAVINDATMHVIVVDINGAGDYTTIQDAVNAAHDGDIVYIKSGWYEESVVSTKQIAVIGQDKESTILFNATGEYATPPLWTCSGRWENLTVYAWNRDNKSFDSLTRLGYALHLDQKWDSVHSRRHIEIRNCIFKSDFNDCIGCGIDEDGYIEISNTICEATRRSGMKVHPFPVAGGTSKVLLKNNVFKKGADDNAYGLMFHTGGTDNVNFNTVQVEAYNNIAKTYDGWNTNCFFMDDYNYGNTLAGMNRFSLT